ncbi:MAG: hypothetical protein KDD56_10505, partial [Bdellovibrionales bacterium]|nr:hypothetical protein [Bdellovibrionales bacterium]
MNLTLKDKLFSKLDTPILQLLFFSISVTLLIYVNYYVYNWFFKFSLLGGQIYHQKIIAWEGLRLWRDRLPIVYITLACLLFFWRLSWSKLGLEKSVRILIITCVFIFAWKFSTYDYNLYLSHGHYWDRALLILLALGVYLHPALLPVFLYFLYPMVFQFESPLGLYSWTDKYIPVNILSIFTSYLLISIIRKPSTASLLFTFLCMMGAYYLYPGVGKMKMGPHWYTWMFENELPNLIVSGWLNGWGWWLSEDFVIKFANFFEYLNVPSQIATMIIELGSVFLLFGRRVSSLLLVAFIALHLMIFLTSGIFFWKWIAVDICMIYIIWNLKEQTYRTLFSPFAAIAALPVIIYGNHYFDVIELG